jgi:hypothetical protein
MNNPPRYFPDLDSEIKSEVRALSAGHDEPIYRESVGSSITTKLRQMSSRGVNRMRGKIGYATKWMNRQFAVPGILRSVIKKN